MGLILTRRRQSGGISGEYAAESPYMIECGRVLASMEANVIHEWQPIKDLEDSFNESVHEELRYLADIWQEQKGDFKSEQLDIFNKEIRREWSIETGLIDGIYHLERGVTETLIKHDIRADRILPSKNDDPARVAAMLHDHERVIDGLFDFIKDTRELSVSYIKEMHSALLQNQNTTKGVDQFGNVSEIPLLRGNFKKRSNNPRTNNGESHQYCPPEHVDNEMDNLITMSKAHVKKGYPPLATAAWLHHRFTQIHPFQDGNGRVARCLATLIFIKAGWFPLVIRNNDEREYYVDALEAADAGDLSPLVSLFATVQKRYFLDFSRITRKIPQESPMTIIIKSAARKVKQHDYENAKEMANKLIDCAHKRIEEVCAQIKQEFGSAVNTHTSYHKNGDPNSYLWEHVQRKAGIYYKHHPNTDAYCACTSVHISTKPITDIILIFQGVGQEYRGVITCFACAIIEGAEKFTSDEIFKINYKEPPEETQKRFEEWLNKVTLNGVCIWRDALLHYEN